MLKNLQEALLELETAFNSKMTGNVLEKTNSLSKELELLKESNNKTVENEDLNNITSLIEKLSIQNEYKLNLLKEFPKYISNKK